ncbi:hypothetical protein PINS_up017185 [Pythium insidiosum]|nr:hypothetical protein PINS_up009810 [Pythium insidiosum]GLE07188.1 hypothetical protein PINS_up017185 [Pythium insidiosum]
MSHGVGAPRPAADEERGFKVYGSVFQVDARYEFLNPLGKGSYGIVWCAVCQLSRYMETTTHVGIRLFCGSAAMDRETGHRVAIKKVCPMAKRSVDAKHTLREVLLLQFLGKHPNVRAPG